ncbi:SecY-interacting protein Syd [Bacillus sp. WMMC1349]|uniref:SecY-interacting protein Syd n=1 Tax=Bacillus sp. WMMC1349 TaxID=2736254 RepID=UPI001553A357|nr:SecY-interacting protein Syd [Bacillus sp. WMMC1349]
MDKYFNLRRAYFDKGLDFLFKTSYNEEVDSFIYQGEVDEEEEVLWKVVEKNNYKDLTPIEEKFSIKLHTSISYYFNSYWFADLDGFIGHHYIALESVLPNIELISFEKNLEGYKNNHHNKMDKIPIGIEGNGLIVVLDNINGKVELEDFERGSFNEIATTLDELISSLSLQK